VTICCGKESKTKVIGTILKIIRIYSFTGTVNPEEIREVLRPTYSRNADSLIAVSRVVAIHYKAIAAANNYWRFDC
jgi:hypothetical protein